MSTNKALLAFGFLGAGVVGGLAVHVARKRQASSAARTLQDGLRSAVKIAAQPAQVVKFGGAAAQQLVTVQQQGAAVAATLGPVQLASAASPVARLMEVSAGAQFVPLQAGGGIPAQFAAVEGPEVLSVSPGIASTVQRVAASVMGAKLKIDTAPRNTGIVPASTATKGASGGFWAGAPVA